MTSMGSLSECRVFGNEPRIAAIRGLSRVVSTTLKTFANATRCRCTVFPRHTKNLSAFNRNSKLLLAYDTIQRVLQPWNRENNCAHSIHARIACVVKHSKVCRWFAGLR